MRTRDPSWSHPCTHGGLRIGPQVASEQTGGSDKNHSFASWPEYPKIKCLLPTQKQVITPRMWINRSLRRGLRNSTVFLSVWGMLSSGGGELNLWGTSLMSHARAGHNWKRLNREKSGVCRDLILISISEFSSFQPKLENKMTREEPSQRNLPEILRLNIMLLKTGMWGWEYSSAGLSQQLQEKAPEQKAEKPFAIQRASSFSRSVFEKKSLKAFTKRMLYSVRNVPVMGNGKPNQRLGKDYITTISDIS